MEVIERKIAEVKKNLTMGFLTRIIILAALELLVTYVATCIGNKIVGLIVGAVMGYLLAASMVETYVIVINGELQKIKHVAYIKVNHEDSGIPEKREAELDLEDNHIPHID